MNLNILNMEVGDWSVAMMAVTSVMQQYPNQEINTQVPVSIRGRTFTVTRNQESYTVELT